LKRGAGQPQKPQQTRRNDYRNAQLESQQRSDESPSALRWQPGALTNCELVEAGIQEIVDEGRDRESIRILAITGRTEPTGQHDHEDDVHGVASDPRPDQPGGIRGRPPDATTARRWGRRGELLIGHAEAESA